jgi:gliding motility-associated protein GldM
MKTITKTLLVFLSILSFFTLNAQTDATAVVAADKLNVFYIGVDNPISVAVPGIASDKLRVIVNNGTITGSNGKYIVRVGNTTETVVQVAAEINPGEVKVISESKFRVKRIPEPVACIGNKCEPDFLISKTELLKNPQIGVSLNLPFELKFEVVSFTMTMAFNKTIITEQTSGNKLSQKMIDIINGMTEGHKFFIEEIKAVGPDGNTRLLGSLSVTLML